MLGRVPQGSSPSRAPPGGRLVEDPVAVCFESEKNDFEKQIVGKKEEFALSLWWLGQGRGGCQVFPASAHPQINLVSRDGEERQRRGEVCPFRVAPGSVSAVSASVHKGIWRAWWRPPCYLVQAQKGVSRAFLPTCDHSLSA